MLARLPLTMLTLLMIPVGFKSAKGGNHENYVVYIMNDISLNDDVVHFVVDDDVIDDT